MNRYIRKTRDTWQIHVYYGHANGWEHETTEATRAEGKAQLQCYAENCTYPARLVKRREQIEGGTA